MTATDVLRRLLDERGVEYDTDDEDGCEFTEWVANGLEWEADSRGELVSLMPVMLITPAQAIAATLGPAARHPKPHEKWTTVLLPEIAWSWDDSWPDYLSVAHDTHGEWRMYVPEATLGTGTCRNTAPSYLDFLCSECGFVHYHSDENDSGDGNEWHYCPNCGRRIEQ